MSGEPRVIAEAWGHRVFDNGFYVTTETYALWFPGTVTALLADLAKRLREEIETLESFRKEDTDSVVGLANEHVRLNDRIEAVERMVWSTAPGTGIQETSLSDRLAAVERAFEHAGLPVDREPLGILNRVTALESRQQDEAHEEPRVERLRRLIGEAYLGAPTGCGGSFGELLCYELHSEGCTFIELAKKWGVSLPTLGELIYDHCKRLESEPVVQQDEAGKGASSPGPDEDDAEMFHRGWEASRRETAREIVEGLREKARQWDRKGERLNAAARFGVAADIEREFAGGADPEPVPLPENAPTAVFFDLGKEINPWRTIPSSVRTQIRREHSDGRPGTPADEVPRIRRGDRGFVGYGTDAVLGHGGEFEVYESSSIKPRVWLRSISASPSTMVDETGSSLEIQLDRTAATDLRDRLQAWLDDHPESGERTA